MKKEDISFSRLYTNIKNKLQRLYKLSGSSFDLSSPFGMILRTVVDLFTLNQLNITNVVRSFDLNDSFNNNTKNIRSLARLGQYNPQRGISANGSIKIQLKQNINAVEEVGGNYVIFYDKMRLRNSNNSLDYTLRLNKEDVRFSLLSNNPILLNVVQGTYKESFFTGTSEINQSIVVPYISGKEIDEYDIKVYVNSILWNRKKHKYDMLDQEQAYVAYTSFSGGVDIIFGNGNEGAIPPLGAEIRVEYLVHNGTEGNIVNYQMNDFQFIDMPYNDNGDDVNIEDIAAIFIDTDINYGTNGDTVNDLKQILPYATPNFVLSGPEQYKFFLKRLKIFSTIDVFTSDKVGSDIKKNIYELCKKNIELLNKINVSDNADSIKILVEKNLKEIEYLRKLFISSGSESLVNLFLVPDIRTFFGNDKSINYFNADLDIFTLDEIEKKRILNYLYQDGIQTVTNDVVIIDPVIRKFAINITTRLFNTAIETNVINNIQTVVSDYFLSEMRRDKIPTSDLIRLIDQIDGVDSVTVEFISEQNENYHKEYLAKSQQYFLSNKELPKDSDIMMNDGETYNSEKTIGLDPLLGDIILQKDELPIIRGGFTDRYGNNYSIQPGSSAYSPINILVLPERSKKR